MEDRETARMRKYGESKTTGIMMATVPHVTSGLGLRKFQADGFLLTRVYRCCCEEPRNGLDLQRVALGVDACSVGAANCALFFFVACVDTVAIF